MDEKLKSEILLEEQSISHRGLSKPPRPPKNPVPLGYWWELDAHLPLVVLGIFVIGVALSCSAFSPSTECGSQSMSLVAFQDLFR